MHILDIGCGNGKMLKYLHKSIGGHIYGFDFSENAIETARLNSTNSMDFRVGVIGEIDYPNESFDMITSMDSIYFANDMKKFVGQVKKWLKKGGIFFVGYQEGDVMPKTMNSETTVLSHALKENGLSYEVSDITQQTYNMLKNKRNAIINFKDDFIKENLQDWYEMVLDQTNCVVGSFEKYAIENVRYIYLAKL